MEEEIIHFHGGCGGCTQQIVHLRGIEVCRECCYFDADWKLPNLNNRPPTKAELKKIEMGVWPKRKR
jgi:hypothetical protein